MKVGYVCTTLNSSDVTVAAARSFFDVCSGSCIVVAVDNGSRQSEVEELQEFSIDNPWFSVCCNGENHGYFEGLNIGIRYFRERYPDVEWLVIGNNDITFHGGFLRSLESRESFLTRYPVISPNVVTAGGERQNPHVIKGVSWTREIVWDLYYSSFLLAGIIQFLGHRFHKFVDRADESEWRIGREIYQGHGSLYILTPLFFATVKELWAPTIFGGEEFFLAKQLYEHRARVYYEPLLEVTHLWHGTVGAFPAKKKWELGRAAHQIYRQYVRPLMYRNPIASLSQSTPSITEVVGN